MIPSNKQDHLDFRKTMGRFSIDCSRKIFSREEVEILLENGHWFHALTSGKLTPISPEQERFLAVMKGEMPPSSLYESAWFKYLGRKAIEKKHGDRLHRMYQSADNSFYSREGAKKVRGMMFSENSKVHRS